MIFVLWFMMGGVVAVIAHSKRFDTTAWFLYGALIWPVALTHVIVKPAAPPSKPTTFYQGDQEKTCPECAEVIKEDAKVCRFCGNRTFQATEPATADEEAWFADLNLSALTDKPTMWQKIMRLKPRDED